MIVTVMGVLAMLGAQAAEPADLRQPGNVAAALRTAGYKAEVKVNKSGEPYVQSATNGANFTIDFFECDGLKDCKSFQIWSWYKKDPLLTPALANEWNNRYRFLKVWIDSDGDMREAIDATVVGGMSQAQFAELVDWYTQLDGQLAKFIEEKRAAAKK
ncbi:YbjN domain-containing protein [Sphingomonas sp. VNH70]|uniref:YbjN domain-containing protein n=1 Tax=Sphingomonas silueang TaxID=3156617 RepID=UPI0032B62228